MEESRKEQIIRDFVDLYEQTQIQISEIHPSLMPKEMARHLTHGLMPGIGEAVLALEIALTVLPKDNVRGKKHMALLGNTKDIITRYGKRYTAEEWKLKKQLEQEDSEEETTEAERKAAEEEFCAALRKIGAPEEAIAKLVAIGPLQISQKMERGELRFSTTEKAQAVSLAVNAWGRKIY